MKWKTDFPPTSLMPFRKVNDENVHSIQAGHCVVHPASPGGDTEIEALALEISRHSDLYYSHATPEISDNEFDLLVERLRRLDPTHPQLTKVGSDPVPGSEKVIHLFPMRSLDKATLDTEIIHFVTETVKSETRFLIQPKLDGTALSLEYRLGRLVRAATRGNGIKGEDVTANARRVIGVPERLLEPVDVHIRGEVVMPLEIFHRSYSHISPNPRNLASGALRQKYSDGKADVKDLRFFAYDVLFPSHSDRHPDAPQPPPASDDSSHLEWLTKMGVSPAEWDVVESLKPTISSTKIIEKTQKWMLKRSEFPYEIDGVVIKVDALAQRNELGNTAHHPRWALAWKFAPEVSETVLLDVSWKTGRTGVVTPVAKVAPQMVGGVTVEHVTLHNIGEIKRLGIQICDRVRLVRRGDVIPKIESVIGPAKEEDLKDRFHADGRIFKSHFPLRRKPPIPTNCPECGVFLVEDGAFLRCSNMTCGGRGKHAILYWCRFLEMDGIGEKLVDQLMSAADLKSVVDLYRLDFDQLLALDRMGERSASNVLLQIEKTRKLTLYQLLSALGLPRIGPEISLSVAHSIKKWPELENLVRSWDALPGQPNGGPECDGEGRPYKHNSSIRRLTSIEGVGALVAEQLLSGLATRSDMIGEILSEIELIDDDSPPNSSTPLSLVGMSICLTGTLSMPRKEIQKIIRNAGGRPVSSISSKLDLLIVGENAGSKLEKATSFGINIVDEEAFFELISDNQPT